MPLPIFKYHYEYMQRPFLTPDTPPKSSGPVTADSEGGADGSGASLRLAIGN
jgi:hypothetical protein